MEKLFIIGAEICAFILSALCVYHYLAGNCENMVMLFSLMFAAMAVWCHRIQKLLKFDFRL